VKVPFNLENKHFAKQKPEGNQPKNKLQANQYAKLCFGKCQAGQQYTNFLFAINCT